MGKSVLVIEDDLDASELLTYNLTQDGYKVIACSSGETGLSQAFSDKPDLILLDLSLPGIDGLEVCRRLRADSSTRHVPVIMLTVRKRENDIVQGLNIGADDYITKPYRIHELLARINASLRRAETWSSESRILTCGQLRIDSDTHFTSVNGKAVVLTATEFRMLHCLAKHPGRVFTREQLIDTAIGDDVIVQTCNVDTHICSLRRKLADCKQYIETIWGVGYRFTMGNSSESD
jgi:DNA-binding response OmpR family regulator